MCSPFHLISLSFCISKLLVKKRFFPLESLEEERCSEQGDRYYRLRGTCVGGAQVDRAAGILLFPLGIPTNLNVAVRTSQEIQRVRL